MPTIGWFEILIIVVIAIIILGPKDFPLMLKKVGSWIGSIKRYVNDVQIEVTSITDETINKNLNDEVNDEGVQKNISENQDTSENQDIDKKE